MVYVSLRDAIVAGEITAGERLIIDELARKFDVSHIPVREALQMLGSEGFVVFRPHAGATVTEVSEDAIAEVFDLLEALEIVSSAAACNNTTPEEVERLRTIVKGMDDLVDQPEAWSEQNHLFHLELCKMAGYALTLQLQERVKSHWDRIRRRFLLSAFTHHIKQAQSEHWDMIKALENGDSGQLTEIIRRHNRTAREAYERILSENSTRSS